jgi:hypothetical protein
LRKGLVMNVAPEALSPMTYSSPTSVDQSHQVVAWHFVFLEHLNEFATLAWYLVADASLVEEVFVRTLASLELMPFDVSAPHHTYHQAHDTLISEALAVLNPRLDGRCDERKFVDQTVSVCELPDLARLAVLLSPGTEIAQLSNSSPAIAPELAQRTIARLSNRFSSLAQESMA